MSFLEYCLERINSSFDTIIVILNLNPILTWKYRKVTPFIHTSYFY